MQRVSLYLLAILSGVAQWGGAADVVSGLGVRELLLAERHDLTASHIYSINTEGFRPGGSLCVLDLLTGRKRVLVESPRGAVMNCDLSYDGTKVVFAWRQNEADAYHLYTINLDGSALKQLTSGPYVDYDPCWLPDGGIAFVSTRSAGFAFCFTSPVGNLYRMEADGSGLKRLSYGNLNDLTPSVLSDGRILFTRWEYVDRNAIPIQSLWTIRPDGTGVQGYFGNRILDPGTFMHAMQVPGSSLVVCTLAGHNGPCRGALGLIDIRKGGHCQEAIFNLTPDVDIGHVDRGNGNKTAHKPYESPVPLNATLFVNTRLGQLQLRDYSGSVLTNLTPETKEVGFYSPRPVMVRARPPVLKGVFPDAVRDPFHATVFMQDVYVGLEPAVKRGEVKQLMIVEEGPKPIRAINTVQVNAPGIGWRGPVISWGAAFTTKKVWGVVDVESDGSARFKVPGHTPVYFLALDGEGRTIQRMRTFTHFVPGEFESCIGCHADRNYVAPMKDAGSRLAMRKPTQEMRPAAWGTNMFNYVTMVQPIWDRHCIACHNPRQSGTRLDLTGDYTELFNVSYDTLVRDQDGGGKSPYTCWIPTGNGFEWAIREIGPRRWGSPRSKLADLILGGHPDASGKPRIALNDAEKRTVFGWIDLNVPYYDTMDAAYPEAPGMRFIDRSVELKAVISEVVQRRHLSGPLPRAYRILSPENCEVLCGNLARSAGGAAPDETAAFKTKEDPDYQKILVAWQPLVQQLKERPRDDMPGAKPSPSACRKSY